MNKIALITAYGWVGVSSPLINTALYLSELDYIVDIYKKEDKFCDDLGLNKIFIKNENINIKHYKASQNKDEKQIFLKNMEEIQEYIFQELDYKFLIGFDPEGLIKAGMLGAFLKIPYVYFSLEIYEKKDTLKELEIYFNKDAIFTISQDQYRIDILSKINLIDKEKCQFIWNSSFDNNIVYKQNDYFRKKFNIDKNSKIILATGTLMTITGIDKLIESKVHLQEGYVVVLHGWLPERNIKEYVLSKIDNENLFLSEDIVPYIDKDMIFSSVDYGYIYYDPIDLNLKSAAGSSGKLFDFMKVGVPVIANDIPNMKEYVSNNKCGEVFADIDDIYNKIRKINCDYEFYRNNAFNAYKKYSFKDSFNLAMRGII